MTISLSLTPAVSLSPGSKGPPRRVAVVVAASVPVGRAGRGASPCVAPGGAVGAAGRPAAPCVAGARAPARRWSAPAAGAARRRHLRRPRSRRRPPSDRRRRPRGRPAGARTRQGTGVHRDSSDSSARRRARWLLTPATARAGAWRVTERTERPAPSRRRARGRAAPAATPSTTSCRRGLPQQRSFQRSRPHGSGHVRTGSDDRQTVTHGTGHRRHRPVGRRPRRRRRRRAVVVAAPGQRHRPRRRDVADRWDGRVADRRHRRRPGRQRGRRRLPARHARAPRPGGADVRGSSSPVPTPIRGCARSPAASSSARARTPAG